MKNLFVMILLLCSFSSFADYANCTISSGNLISCGGWANADKFPVLQSDDNYHECRISSGSVTSCGGWANATNFPVLQSDGDYHSCNISSGSVTSCSTWYNGDTILEK